MVGAMTEEKAAEEEEKVHADGGGGRCLATEAAYRQSSSSSSLFLLPPADSFTLRSSFSLLPLLARLCLVLGLSRFSAPPRSSTLYHSLIFSVFLFLRFPLSIRFLLSPSSALAVLSSLSRRCTFPPFDRPAAPLGP